MCVSVIYVWVRPFPLIYYPYTGRSINNNGIITRIHRSLPGDYKITTEIISLPPMSYNSNRRESWLTSLNIDEYEVILYADDSGASYKCAYKRWKLNFMWKCRTWLLGGLRNLCRIGIFVLLSLFLLLWFSYCWWYAAFRWFTNSVRRFMTRAQLIRFDQYVFK